MANWYTTSFKTFNQDIVEVIKNSKVIDFDYNQDTGMGSCRLAWGLNALDLDEIENIAVQNRSNLKVAAYDIYTCTEQEYEIIDGVVVICESRQKEIDFSIYE